MKINGRIPMIQPDSRREKRMMDSTGFNQELDEARGNKPLLSKQEIFSTVRREQSIRKIILRNFDDLAARGMS
jgi:hypothetical protein